MQQDSLSVHVETNRTGRQKIELQGPRVLSIVQGAMTHRIDIPAMTRQGACEMGGAGKGRRGREEAGEESLHRSSREEKVQGAGGFEQTTT